MNEKKQRWTYLIILVISVALSFLLGKNLDQKEQDLFSLLRQNYSNSFTVKTFTIKNFIATHAYSNIPFFNGDTVGNPIDKEATPRLIVQNLNNPKIDSIYKVSFTNSGEETSGNLIYSNMVEAKGDLLIAEWGINYGGSSGLKGFVLFGVKDEQLLPLTGYPFDASKKSSINLTDELTSKKFSFPITGDSNFSEITDMNKDGRLDLLFADWKWDLENGEAHYVPRPWNLQVFELVDNKFIIAKWWNKGEVYKTPEDIGYSEADKARLKQIFIDKTTTE